MVFLNLVVQNICMDGIQDFMKAWMSLTCKDFRIVFIDKGLTELLRIAVNYAKSFAKAISHEEMVAVVDSIDSIPQACTARELKGTSVLPKSIDEVALMKKDAKASTASSASSLLKRPLLKKVFFKIVLPNCNNMAYIKKCLDSILSLTFQDFIAIVIDDMSKDNSSAVAKAFARRHPEKVIAIDAKKKLYAGGCRNIGIDYPVLSKYTVFIDTDDWLYSNDSLQQLYDTIEAADLPKIVRAPMLHYFGKGSPKNFYDRFTSVGKKYMFMCGPGPGRTIVRSDICLHFVEGRAKCNDVVWFLRCIDKAPNSNDVVNSKSAWYTYNRISSTSCLNDILKLLDKKCIDDLLAVADDLEKETFLTEVCRLLAKYKIDATRSLYKLPITLEACLKNAFFITIDNSRARAFASLFKSYGIVPIPKKLKGCTDHKLKVTQRCCKSHIDAVKMAKYKGLPFVCIFEDDAYPCIDVANMMARYLYAIPNDACLVLLGWCNCTKNGILSFSKPFNRIKTSTISGAHSYIVFKEGYDLYLNFFKLNPNGLADCGVFNAVNNSYVVDYPLFILYSKSKSMNDHVGYIFYGDHKQPPRGFLPIDAALKRTSK